MAEIESPGDARPRATAEPFTVTWWAHGERRQITVWGATPRKAFAQARRVRRDFWLGGKHPGWVTLREQLKWSRLARRIGLV